MGEWVKHGMSAHDIYQYFATGRGTSWLDDGQDATRAEWDLEADRAKMIRKQGELIRGGWQGEASEGAFGAAQPLAESALEGATLLSRAEDLLDRQSGSFHRAANSVTPVPEEPPDMGLSDPLSVFTDYEAEVKAYQAQAHHNMDVYRGYDGASEYNQTNMPAEYSTVNHSGGNISVTSGDDRSGDYLEVPEHEEPRNRSEPGPYGGPGPGGDPGPGAGPVSRPPVGGPPVSSPIPNPPLPQQTTPSNYVPPAINPPGQVPPNPYPPPGPGQPGFAPGLPVGGVTGGVSGGGPGARGGGPRGGGGYGGGPAGNPGLGAGARGAIPGPGASTGAIPADEASARRAAAAAAGARGGAPGAMGGAPLGAGRGKGDEDEEHQRKVLIETDGESMFGSDELTAPQVIGDDEYEDD